MAQEYAIVDNGVIVGTRVLDEAPAPLPGKPYRKVLPVFETKPDFDPATSVLEAPVVTVLANQVTRVWSVRAKTAQELDSDREAKLSAMDQVQFLLLFNHENRLRTLESKPTITMTQFRNFIKGML